jgi:hypothetical protein
MGEIFSADNSGIILQAYQAQVSNTVGPAYQLIPEYLLTDRVLRHVLYVMPTTSANYYMLITTENKATV